MNIKPIGPENSRLLAKLHRDYAEHPYKTTVKTANVGVAAVYLCWGIAYYLGTRKSGKSSD